MKNIFLILTVLFTLLGCETKGYLEKYSGSYAWYYNGELQEEIVFTLQPDGGTIHEVYEDRFRLVIRKNSFGEWEAEKGQITIKFGGNEL